MSEAPPYRFGMSEYTTTPATFDQDLAMYTEVGVDGIEVCQFKLDMPRAGDQLRRAQGSGLEIFSVQPQVHSIYPDTMALTPAAPRERMAAFRALIDIVAPIVPGVTMVSITGPAPKANFKLAYETAITHYRKLAEYAHDKGVRIALEPLNPVLMNVDSFIGTIPDALDIIDGVGHPAFGIWLDVWHYWQDPKWPEHVARCAGRIFGVHVSDWRRPSAFGDRLVVGTGEIPLGAMVRAIHETGYRGPYTAELFSDTSLPDSLWNGDLKNLVSKNKAGFASIWHAAFSD